MAATMIALGAAGVEPWASTFGFSGGGGGGWDDDGDPWDDEGCGCILASALAVVILAVCILAITGAFS